MKIQIKLITALIILSLTGFRPDDLNLSITEQNVHMETDKLCGYIPVNGIMMYYEIYGEGNPLVLIHGGGSTIQTTFGNVIPELSRGNKIIAVELQGHGHTSDRNSPESFEQDADDVAGLLHSLQISRASFFGFSNGGNTAIQIAFRHPEIVNKLILASTFYKRDGLQNGFFESMKQASLIICGDRDVVTSDHAVAMSKLISDSRLIILPATHGSYLGVAESQAQDFKLVGLTVDVIKDFLMGKEAF